MFGRSVGLVALLLAAGLLVPAVALAEPALMISPAAGPSGVAVDVRATGLSPATSYLVQVVRGTGNINTVRVFETTATTDAQGALATTLTVSEPPGAYSVRIVAFGGTVIVTTGLTITGGNLPGLPRTGAGGMTEHDGSGWWALAVLAGSLVAAGVILRRYRVAGD